MENCFMVRVMHDGEVWDKGVEVKDDEDSALQSFHARMGAYGYGNKPSVDYLYCAVIKADGVIVKSEVYNKKEEAVV